MPGSAGAGQFVFPLEAECGVSSGRLQERVCGVTDGQKGKVSDDTAVRSHNTFHPPTTPRNTPLSTLVSGVKTPPQETSVGEDDGTQKPFHRECFYVTGTRLSLITTSSPLVTVFDWEVVMGGESRSWSRGWCARPRPSQSFSLMAVRKER